jgi:putative endonuclease
MAFRQRTGRWGEEIAANFLKEKGYEIIARNARSMYGELDIVATHEGQVIFVEVKTRSNKKFGFPEESIQWTKTSHLVNSANAFLQEHLELNDNWRIDVITVEGHPDRKASPEIHWFIDAIR